MRLKSLEIKGFKSFGNPTVLHFDENVTGVVGPNGSGKSNVVDAFRWVLGEQKSKELRLEQMGDVLFNGADKKQQANHAEVSVTFDNTKNLLPTEYNTVRITRALYRSGESEYRINDTICRLKDIRTLLMDTGIGSNSYSIIELGMVDDILSDKENARRRMFEQAAGISKFKKRKKETLQKLKLTSDDLERIEDLLFEIEKNLKDLEKQAKRTKKFFEIKEKYKVSSIHLSKVKWDLLESAVVELNEKIDKNKAEYNTWITALAENEAVLEKEKKNNLEGERSLSNFQKQLNQLLDDIRRSENEKSLFQQKITFSEKNIAKARHEIGTTEPLLAETAQLKIDLKQQFEQKEKIYKAHKAKLDELHEQVEQFTSKFQTDRTAHQEKATALRKWQETIFDLDKELAVAQNKIDTFAKDLQDNELEMRQIQEGTASQHVMLNELREKLSITSRELQTLVEKEKHRKEVILNTEQSITSQREIIAKSNRKMDALVNERDLLKSMVENLEGFSESVKFLHTQWNGKKVLLSDIINTEEQYRAAVERVLQPYLNYFIVEDLEEARSAIHLLKSSQKGRAQFFLLKELGEISKPIDQHSIATVIETEEKYKKLIHKLCGHVYLKTEREIYNSEPEGGVFISLDGSILKGLGEIGGGSVGLFEGKKIGRKQRIAHIDKELRKEEKELSKQNTKLEELLLSLQETQSAQFTNELKVKERLCTDTEKEIALAQSSLSSADLRISDLTNRRQGIENKLLETKEKLQALKNKKVDIKAKIDALNQEISSKDSILEKLNSQLSQARASYNAQNIELIKSENLLQVLRKDINYQDRRSIELKQNLAVATNTLERQKEELQTSTEKLAILESTLTEKYLQKEKEQENLSQAEQEYFKARALANQLEDGIRSISKNINDKQYLINQLKDKLNDYKFKKNSIKERLKIEFDYNVSDLLDLETAANDNEAELELQVEKFRRRLDNYGEINPMALEAYDEMEKRYVHITEQRDDINSAKISLMNTISEIEETATQLFLESFQEVRKHFVVVFRSLFTQGDNCDLILEDESDPLNSKIEIIAKPKGKRPKSLSQLSGGEKTLTATALLFSLYLLKPAPFCIFDEVDAPLDDTNIQKFANIIRAFSDKSQFIIVTHNKATMAEVDVLYGVYMQKKGISSVSAVDFRSYEDKGTVANVALDTF